MHTERCSVHNAAVLWNRLPAEEHSGLNLVWMAVRNFDAFFGLWWIRDVCALVSENQTVNGFGYDGYSFPQTWRWGFCERRHQFTVTQWQDQKLQVLVSFIAHLVTVLHLIQSVYDAPLQWVLRGNCLIIRYYVSNKERTSLIQEPPANRGYSKTIGCLIDSVLLSVWVWVLKYFTSRS